MELTKEQLLQIHNYLYVCGIKFYDVRTEVLDHFATILEKKLAENPDLDFKQEIIKIHKNFSDSGFSKLLKQKIKSVTKKFYAQSFLHFSTFFKLPKIIITGALFYVLHLFMNTFTDKKDFFLLMVLFLFLVFVIQMSLLAFFKRKKKEEFLVLDRSTNFMAIITTATQFFHTLTSLRKPESFLNATDNNMQLVVFMVLLFFYWCGEYVYRKNRKEVQQQYPNIVV